MPQKDHQKKHPSFNRKTLLQSFLATTNIQHTKNSIRSIIDAHTHNISLQTITNAFTTPVKPVKELPTGSDLQISPLTDAIKGLKDPLMQIVQQNTLIVSKLQKIKTESRNAQKPSHQQVHIDIKEHPTWKVWMGKVFDQIFQRTFHLYSSGTLQYDQMRAFCCEKILLNLIAFELMHSDALKATPCIEWQEEVKKIIEHQCNKYPQTAQVEINKKLQQIVNRNQINNFESDDYDLIDKTSVQFRYKQSGDYTEEIMNFVNKVITLPQKTQHLQKGHQSLFTNFHIFFTNVFNLVSHRNTDKDMLLLLNQELTDEAYCQYKFMGEEQIEYKDKVRAYTKMQLGAKIPLNSPVYSYDEIVSGNIEIKSKPVSRVVDKWIDELREKILHPEKFVNERTHRFKGQEAGQRTKLTTHQKHILVQKLSEQKQLFTTFHQKIKLNGEELSQKLMNDLNNFPNLSFMDEHQRSVGEFACKMQQASVQYSIQKLNFLISALAKAVEHMKCDINKTKPYSFIGEDIKLNLVTFKIGDLLRCKFASKQDEVIRVFEFLITMSEMSYRQLFKIVRVKNRLHLSTRDILINALFKNEVVCEIQLAVNQANNQKQKFMDKFNHFLYELKRAEVGTMLEICNIWVNNSPKSETFKKALLIERQRKLKNRQTVCANTVFQMIENKHKIQKLPFICKLCKIFYPRQRTIFASVIFDQYPDPICGQCLSTRIEKIQRIKYLFGAEQKPAHIANYLSKFRLYETITELFDLEQVKKQKYLILIPIESRKINKFAVTLVQTEDMWFLVENYLTEEGKLEMSVKYQFSALVNGKQEEKKFFGKYCIFTISQTVSLKRVALSKHNFNALLQKDFKKIQTYQSKNQNRLHCLYMQFGEESVLFPHYNDPTVDLVEKLKNNMNLLKIIKHVKNSKQVLELSGIQLANEMNLIPSGIKIKINTIVKQLYLNENLLQNIDFFTHIHALQILTAKKNKITQIPQLPENLQILDLASNQITRIQGFSHQPYQKLRVLYLCLNHITQIQNLNNAPNLQELSLFKNQISHIQNLDQLPKLQRLNLSFNPIQQLQNLSALKSLNFLSIGNTQINHISTIDNLHSLTTLILDVSSISLNDTHTLDLPTRIKNLNLSNNNITSLTPFKHLDQIQQLILHNNTIHSFHPSQWLQNIKLLNLSENRIEQIPEMKTMTDLQQLYLAHNQIQEIKGLEENMFLRVLDVSHNKIKHLKNIKYLVNLTKLSARNNKIEQMQDFDNLKSLNELHLSNNLIQTIMSLPSSMKKIDLQNNRIKSLEWVSVLVKKKSEQDKVEQINLKNNHIPAVMIALVKTLLGIPTVKIIV